MGGYVIRFVFAFWVVTLSLIQSIEIHAQEGLPTEVPPLNSRELVTAEALVKSSGLTYYSRCAGDVDGDRKVTGFDKLIVQYQFFQLNGAHTKAAYTQGDQTGDMRVTLADYQKVIQNMDTTCAAAASARNNSARCHVKAQIGPQGILLSKENRLIESETSAGASSSKASIYLGTYPQGLQVYKPPQDYYNVCKGANCTKPTSSWYEENCSGKTCTGSIKITHPGTANNGSISVPSYTTSAPGWTGPDGIQYIESFGKSFFQPSLNVDGCNLEFEKRKAELYFSDADCKSTQVSYVDVSRVNGIQFASVNGEYLVCPVDTMVVKSCGNPAYGEYLEVKNIKFSRVNYADNSISCPTVRNPVRDPVRPPSRAPFVP